MLRILPLLIFASSLAAQGRVILDPVAPTSLTPIEAHLFILCSASTPEVGRVGNVIKIHVEPRAEICDPPVPSLVPVPIGTLPAGEYRIEVTEGELDSIAATRMFVVREATQSPVEIHPFAVPSNPLGLMLRLAPRTPGAFCDRTDDGPCLRIFVDGKEIPQDGITQAEDGSWWFPAPAHAPGLVSVRVLTANGNDFLISDGLYYYDRSAPPENSVFERILFPVLFEADGARGSHWISEAAIANRRPWYVETWNEVVPYQCITDPCGERISPSSYVAFDGADYPHGIALVAPRAESEHLAFSLRVRDTSGEKEGYGTQVPVVRERDMIRNADLTLLDLPVDPRHRTRIRIYVFDSDDRDASVGIQKLPYRGGGAIEEQVVRLRRTCTGADCEATPAYGELDLAGGSEGERVSVYITTGDGTLAWAFASVTNNETQQVTVVTADGAGGRPGPGYEVYP